MSASSPPPPDAAPATAAGAEAEAEAAPVVLYCHECDAAVSLAAPLPTLSRLLLCPRCRRDFLEENPNPSTSSSPPSPPPPPPGFLSESSSEEPDEVDLALGIDPGGPQTYLSQLIRRLYDDPTSVATAAAAAVSVLRQQGHSGGQGQPPASAASIAAVPTIEVSEPAAICAICKDDLPLAAIARRLPCGHLYHSVCIVQWLEMRNSCPVCRSCLPSTDLEEVEPSEPVQRPTQITIRFTTNPRRRTRSNNDAAAAAPVSTSPTQLAQAMTGEGGAGPANSAETVSSAWPPPPESDAVMSEALQVRASLIDPEFRASR